MDFYEVYVCIFEHTNSAACLRGISHAHLIFVEDFAVQHRTRAEDSWSWPDPVIRLCFPAVYLVQQAAHIADGRDTVSEQDGKRALFEVAQMRVAIPQPGIRNRPRPSMVRAPAGTLIRDEGPTTVIRSPLKTTV